MCRKIPSNRDQLYGARNFPPHVSTDAARRWAALRELTRLEAPQALCLFHAHELQLLLVTTTRCLSERRELCGRRSFRFAVLGEPQYPTEGWTSVGSCGCSNARSLLHTPCPCCVRAGAGVRPRTLLLGQACTPGGGGQCARTWWLLWGPGLQVAKGSVCGDGARLGEGGLTCQERPEALCLSPMSPPPSRLCPARLG